MPSNGLTGNIFITGGSGFLGRGIMRQAVQENWNCSFTVYSRDEYKQDLCRRKYPEADYILGDIRDEERLTLAIRRHDIVIHAAALKYVPQAEANISECIAINVGGTQAVISAARRADVTTVVGISTDKAVEPMNTYGLTKAILERLFVEAARTTYNSKFVVCRYGNVIGSTGSVVPLLKHQQATEGRITLTDPNMTRFWTSISDAVDLIRWATQGENGEITIPVPLSLDLGSLAHAVCGDTPVDIIGLRPGERCHERLLSLSESVRTIKPYPFMYRYGPDRKAITHEPWEVTSDKATRMSEETFVQLAENAETI